MHLPLVVSLLVYGAVALTVKDDLEMETLNEQDATGRSMVRLYGLPGHESFRLSLGLADECTQVIFCKNDYIPPPPPTPSKQGQNVVIDTKYKAEMCSIKDRMTFNLLTNTLEYNGQTKYLVSSVADFILDNKADMHVLKVLKGDQLKTSDLRDGNQNRLSEDSFKVDLKNWTKVAVLASGFGCTAHLETFKRVGGARQEALTLNKVLNDAQENKAHSLPFFMPVGKEDPSMTDSCRESFMKGFGISNLGEYVRNEKSTPLQFEYTLATSQIPDAVSALQLEIQEPQNCEFIRLCFAENCNDQKKVLDLDFYHRYYHPIDSQRARPFQVKVNELDTLVFEFLADSMVFKYGSVASRNQVSWISHIMKSNIGEAPKKLQLVAGKCNFRLGKASAVNLTPTTQKSKPRSKLHVIDCEHTK